jgi:hypothetical protein
MSGGRFDYSQYRISQIAEDIETVIFNNNDDTLDEYGDTRGRHYNDEVIARFREAVKALRVAYVYAQRADWLLSGDDGEDSFITRLDAELAGLEK